MVCAMRILERHPQDAVTKVRRAFLRERTGGGSIIDEPVVGRDARAILSWVVVNHPLSIEIARVWVPCALIKDDRHAFVRVYQKYGSMSSSAPGRNVPWPIAVSFLIQPLAEQFALPEVYAMADPLRRAFPNNRHVEAKIRQSLQILRDRGDIAFEGAGRYRKLRPAARPSVRINFGEAAIYASRSQVARVAIETWAARNVLCWRCNGALIPAPPNTHLLDAICVNGKHEVQVKAFSGIAGDKITGAAFEPIRKRLFEGVLPDYLLISYDRPREVVVLAEYIDGETIVRERIVRRRPLSVTARRAGWVGAVIDLQDLDRKVVVGPSFAPELKSWWE